jgi:HSP20 family molecular chaperone IbpA
LSAKWRRSKRNLNRFNIFKAFNKVKGKNASQKPRVKNSKSKKQPYPYRYRTPKIDMKRKIREPEPLVDVLDEGDEVKIVAECIGFDRKDLRIHVKNQRLTLSAESSDRKFHKSLNLPKRVIPSTIRTTYKNGVLEIQFKKDFEEKTIDKVAG